MTLQSCRLPVHFLVMSIIARYSIFRKLSSVGNTDLGLITFLSCQLKPSMVLVVVDQPPNLLGELEVGAQVDPVVSPGAADFGILLVPALRESVQSDQGRWFIYSCVDCLQVCHKGLELHLCAVMDGLRPYIAPPAPGGPAENRRRSPPRRPGWE